jgi:hypothetical protein
VVDILHCNGVGERLDWYEKIIRGGVPSQAMDIDE